MTIAYILKMYPRFSETFILNEILELERQGVDVRIYSLRKPDDGRFHANLARVRASVTYLPEYLPAEARRVFAAQRAVFRADPRRYTRVLGYALSRGNLHALKRFFQAVVLADDLGARPVTHLHAHFASSATRVAMFVRLLTDTPYSFTAHAKDIFLNTVDADLLRDKIRAARFVVTVSAFNHAYLTRLVNQKGSSSLEGLLPHAEMTIPSDRIRKLYNGIDLAQFDPATDYVPQSQRAPLILGIGRLVEKKGFADLIRACAQLRDRGVAFQCEIIGKGPQDAALRTLIAELALGNQVRLVGPKSQDDVIAAYRRAAVFALPCVVGADGNRDGLPTVLLEAMAMRVPAVSTDVTGVPEIINPDVTGLLTPQNNAATLAAALARLLADAALRERMGDAARDAVAQKFDLQKNVAVLRDWITASPSLRFATAVAPSQSAIGNRQSAIP